MRPARFRHRPGHEVSRAPTRTRPLARSSAMWVRLRCSATWRPLLRDGLRRPGPISSPSARAPSSPWTSQGAWSTTTVCSPHSIRRATAGSPTELQSAFDRVIVLADAATRSARHIRDVPPGRADFTAFSFHAVKKPDDGEGGALAWRAGAFDSDELYRRFHVAVAARPDEGRARRKPRGRLGV